MLRYLLIPISTLYWIAIKFRNKLFDMGLKKSTKPNIKSICIGNITIGGTGKTPHTEYLIRLLAHQFNIAVLSRGYKRKTHGFIEVSPKTTSIDVGDEPLQMKIKFPDVIVAVDADRVEGVSVLHEKHPNINVVILDDAFQHRYIQPGLSILLTDYNNLINKDLMIPTGYLRDSFAERKRANMVVVTKCPNALPAEEKTRIIKGLKLKQEQNVFFSYIDYGFALPIFGEAEKRIKIDKSLHLFALSGIAKPTPFFNYLENNSNLIDKRVFSDHHLFTETEINTIFETIFSNLGNETLLVTTEKDAARLRSLTLPDEVKRKMFYLEIEIKFFDNDSEIFNDKIINYVREN